MRTTHRSFYIHELLSIVLCLESSFFHRFTFVLQFNDDFSLLVITDRMRMIEDSGSSTWNFARAYYMMYSGSWKCLNTYHRNLFTYVLLVTRYWSCVYILNIHITNVHITYVYINYLHITNYRLLRIFHIFIKFISL